MTDKLVYALFGALVVGIIAYFVVTSSVAYGSAPSGLQGEIATSTRLNVAATSVITLIGTTTCSSRIVTTGQSAIALTFSDIQGAVPTGLAGGGHLQAASTTEVYDSGLYGCGRMKAYSYTASNIYITSVR